MTPDEWMFFGLIATVATLSGCIILCCTIVIAVLSYRHLSRKYRKYHYGVVDEEDEEAALLETTKSSAVATSSSAAAAAAKSAVTQAEECKLVLFFAFLCFIIFTLILFEIVH